MRCHESLRTLKDDTEMSIRSTETESSKLFKLRRRAAVLACAIWQRSVIRVLPKNSNRKRVLLYAADNKAAVLHLLKYRESMSNALSECDYYITGRFSGMSYRDTLIELKSECANVDVTAVHIDRAGLMRWDLLVTSSPQNAWWIPAPTLYIGHGDGFKSFDGGKSKYPYDGSLFADRIIEQRHSVIDVVEREYPVYRGRMVWAGGKDAIAIANAISQRDEIRRSMGISEDRKVVLCWGSFRADSLFHALGHDFLEQLEALDKSRYHVILSIHPHEYRRYDTMTEPLGPTIDSYEGREGFTVRHPGQDYVPFVAVSDAMVCDCSSGLDGALLAGIPVVLLETRENVWRDSDYMRMLNDTLTISPQDDVEHLLGRVFGDENERLCGVSREYAKELLPEGGGYAEAVRRATREMLASGRTDMRRGNR